MSAGIGGQQAALNRSARMGRKRAVCLRSAYVLLTFCQRMEAARRGKPLILLGEMRSGGERGIRTPDTAFDRIPV